MRTLVWVLVLCLSGLFGLSAQVVVAPVYESPLTEAQVHSFLRTELAVHQLQKKIQASGEYDTEGNDIIRDFYRQRAQLVARNGWNLDNYEDVRARVYAAVSNIREYERFEKERAQHQENQVKNVYNEQEKEAQKTYKALLAEIEETDFFTEEQKKIMIKNIRDMQVRLQGMGTQIEETEGDYLELRRDQLTQNQTDWPAVRPYLDKFEHLTDWYSGNRSDPPKL